MNGCKRKVCTWLVASTMGAAAAVQADETLQEVEVRGTRADAIEIRRNATAGKLVYDREDLETTGAASISELLSKLPGTGMFADIDNSPRGRGKGPDRNMPQILVDGQPLPGGDRNPAAALRLPVELIERVEVIRNSTAEFPVVSPAGVVNLILKDVPPSVTRGIKVGAGAVGDQPQFRLEGQYGKPDGDSGYLLSGALNQVPMNGQREIITTNYGTTPGQVSENASYSGTDTNATLAPRFSWKIADDQRLTLTPFFSHTANLRDYRLDRVSSGTPSSETQHDDVQRTTGRLGGEWKQTGGRGAETSGKLIVQGESENTSNLSNKFDGGGNLTGTTLDRTERRELEWIGELRAKRLVFDEHLLTVASELRRKTTEDSQRRTGTQTSDTRADLTDNRKVLWAQDEWQLAEQHVLTPGLRLTGWDMRIDDSQSGEISKHFQSLDPSLHYLWQVNEQWNLRGSMAYTSKVPFSRDLLPVTRVATGTNTSSNPDRTGNPDLEPEHIRSFEVGAEHFLPQRAGTIGLSTFQRRVENYSQRLVQLDNGSGRWIERSYNVGDADLRGFLFDFKSKMNALDLPMLTLRGSAAYTRTTMINPVPGLGAGDGPRRSVNLGADYEMSALRLTLGGNLNYVSALDRESSATVQQYQGERRQLDLYALYKLDRQIAVRLTAQNVTRESRHNYLTETDSSGALARTEDDFMPGRASYMLTLEAKW